MNQHNIEIYGIPQSNFTRAVRIVCEEKSISYDYLPVQPNSAEARAIHPLGKIPGLRHGRVRLGESRAIVAYLDGLYPQTPMAGVHSDVHAGLIEQWVSIITTAVDPIMIRQYVFANLFPDTVDGAVDRAVVDAALPTLKALVDMLDGALAGADFLAAGHFTFAEWRGAIDAAPDLTRYFQLHCARASFIATDPWQA